ncbi:hypothetical protein PPL_07165 [Heterostelium album PN500]|uniref:EGF-like domain-containing protein n=1 Tax=Heterostelium pallidum (strain ATCC 26659 / Pp 5 / PN500) TaxID=670386 RepID=D3BEK1_HETP5|nr:hypothetical protein PPL_07165 [Heterostelium album PN500]EFA80332.1 hypothetical protein PPL_07165 [Heterostelium album PN500]|eukprot:XP_020432452.1 hypothetical protein PPL_07165 [Heterostelium album PN500]
MSTIPIQINNGGGGSYAQNSNGCSVQLEFWFNDTLGTETRQIQSNIQTSQIVSLNFNNNGNSYLAVTFAFPLNTVSSLELNISNTNLPLVFDSLKPISYECLSVPIPNSITLGTNKILRDPFTYATGYLNVKLLHKYPPQPYTCATNNTLYTCIFKQASTGDYSYDYFTIAITFSLSTSATNYENPLAITITNIIGNKTTITAIPFVPGNTDSSSSITTYPSDYGEISCSSYNAENQGCPIFYTIQVTNYASAYTQFLPNSAIVNSKPLIRPVTHSGKIMTYAAPAYIPSGSTNKFAIFDGDGYASQSAGRYFSVSTSSYVKFTTGALTIVNNPKTMLWNFKGTMKLNIINNYFPGFRFLEPNNILYTLPYPFGLTSSLKGTTVSYSVSKGISALQSVGVSLNATFILTYQQTLTSTPTGSNLDNSAPQLIGIEYVPLNSNSLIVRVKASDNLSGVYRILIGDASNQIDLRQYDIVYGTKLNGVFEKVYTYEQLSVLGDNVTLIDEARNSQTYPRATTVLSTNSYPLVPQKFSVYPDQITYFEFTPNNIDTSLQFTTGTLQFNVSNADPSFVPVLHLFPNSFDPDFKNRYTFNGTYSTTQQMYVINFKLPMKMVPTSVEYTLSMSPFSWNPRLLYSYIGGNALLNVTSSKSDEHGPYATSFIKVKSSYSFGLNVVPVISWSAKITTLANSFSYGILRVLSDIDPKTYDIYFDQTNWSTTASVYQISLTLEPNCASQTFTIYDLILVDANGYRTENENRGLIDSLIRSNFYSNGADIDVQCSYPSSDSVSPVLSSFDFNPKDIDVGSVNRSVYFEFQVTDINSGPSKTHIPVLYLTSLFDEILSFPVKVKSINSTVATYNLNVTLPYGFGVGGTLVSVYGISDVQLNFIGFSGNELSGAGLPYFINTTLTQTSPILESATNVSVLGGPLTVYGRRFGALLSEFEAFIHYYDSNPFVPIRPTLFSGTVLAFNTSAMPKGAILKVAVRGVESNLLYINSNEPYVPPPIVDPDCSQVNNCSGKGNCTADNICNCNPGWGSIDCSKQTVPSEPPVINPNDPTTIIVGGKISVVKIRELTDIGGLVKEYNLTKQWDYENLTKDEYTLASQYTTTLPDTNTNVTVTVQWFTQPTNVTFAGKTITMGSYTLKYSIYLSPYAFDSHLNHLQVLMSAEMETTESTSCSAKQSGGVGDAEVSWIKLQLNGKTLYMRFLTLADSDGRPTQITNSIVDGSPNKTDNAQKSDAIIGINVPYYDIYTLIDPDFSMLIDTQNEDSTCSKKSSGLSKNALIAIIVCAAAFGVALMAMVAYSIRRHFQRKQLNQNYIVQLDWHL